MKNLIKNQKGFVDWDVIFIGILILIIVGFIGFGIFKFIFARTVGNKTAIDMKYRFDKAIVSINGEKIELDVDTWSDYDGEQIQIITKDGTVYLVSSFNTILIGK